MKKLDSVILGILVLFSLYLWTLPINVMPFGDVDSSVHFTSGDYMAQYDKAIYKLPYYLNYTVGKDTQGKFAYPPQFNVNVGIAQVIGSERIVPSYIFIAILSSLGIIGVYLLVRKLYGFLAGFCAAFLMAFSRRDIMYYLFGLWPQTIAFVFVPVVIYAYYKFIDSINDIKKRRMYLIITMLLIAFQYTFHPQAFFFSIGFIFIYSIILTALQRKLPFKIKEIAMLFIGGVILIIVLAPFQFMVTLGNLGLTKEGAKSAGEFGFKPENIGRLLYWFKTDPKYFGSVPPNYFSYKYVYGGYWTLPLLLLGLAMMLIRRKNQDILVFAWLITLYIFLHMEIFGGNRNFRFLQLEAQLFSAMIAVGLISIASFVKIPEDKKSYLKYGLVLVFIIMGIIFNAKPIHSELKNSYQGILRITPPEYKAAEWLRDNTPEDANILLAGTVAYNKKKWLQGLSFRHFLYDNNLITQYDEGIENANYVFIDYSDLITIGRNDIIQQLHAWEKSKLENATLIYNQENIMVYSIK